MLGVGFGVYVGWDWYMILLVGYFILLIGFGILADYFILGWSCWGFVSLRLAWILL